MKNTIILSSLILVFILFSGCSEDGTDPNVPPNMTPIEQLSIKALGCQSTNNLLKTNDVRWSYTNDTLIISNTFMANCSARFSHSINATENNIEIYLTDVTTMSAKCRCSFKETFTFYAESPKKIKVYFYYRSKSTDEYEDMAFTSIEI
ncbi:MAG: hypothetical protein H6690_00270 [Erysipelotrichaceae bacterium]|nr:hypothetical protein [Erysipelotrichaceae bacterium]